MSTRAPHWRVSRRVSQAWNSIHPPVDVTVLVLVVYIGIALLSIGVLASPPHGGPLRLAVTITALLGILCGALGAPAAWRGTADTERIAIYLGVGHTLALSIVMVGATSQWAPDPTVAAHVALRLAAALTMLGHWGTRWARLRHVGPWVPGSHAEPEEYARARVAKVQDEMAALAE